MTDSRLHPRFEGTVRLPDGRQLGFTEFGPMSERVVLWMHGTPGSSHQVPPEARRAAHALGVRLIGLDRPGYGRSTPHCHESVRAAVDDYVVLLDALGIRQVGVTGLSGGGPYVLGLAHRLPSRVVAVSLLGGVAPSHGPEGIAGGLVAVAVACRDLLPVLREPLGWLLSTAIQASRPVSDVVALPAIRALLAEADARELEDDDLRAVFVGDILRASRRWLSGPFYDATLFATDWGFSLADVAAPVHIWQGDADDIVPLAHGVHQSRLLPRSTLTVQPGFGHLGGLGLGREVLEAILSHWPTERSGTVHAG